MLWVTPTQIDAFGQTNISCIGDYDNPKVQLLGVRGFPGNFISHKNSIFIPNHSIKSFVQGEVDMVSGMGVQQIIILKQPNHISHLSLLT